MSGGQSIILATSKTEATNLWRVDSHSSTVRNPCVFEHGWETTDSCELLPHRRRQILCENYLLPAHNQYVNPKSATGDPP